MANDIITIPHTVTWKNVAYTTAQTGVSLWTPAAGKHVAITYVDMQAAGTTAGTCRLWFGATADTSFTQDTDQPVIYFNAATPSSTVTPFKTVEWAIPVVGGKDKVLKVTTVNNLTIDIIIYGYEV